MDKNNSFNKEFSWSPTKIGMPITEVTSSNINGKRSPVQFRWGDTLFGTITYRSDLAASKKSMSDNSGLYSKSTKIDSRTYADVRSSGLASRIVKYHEKEMHLKRSLSSSMYNKSDRIPTVHLKKTSILHRATKQITHIAPEDKSTGNTLPNILYSNTPVAMQNSDEEILSENRPILHPPQTRNEQAPTRSVLEVLKEVSRKRINSEHLVSNDKMRKYCGKAVSYQSNFMPNSHQNKRQRDQISSKSSQMLNHKPTQNSPEQMPKKRLCSYNNDITSSLSSSQIHRNKRKLYEFKHNTVEVTKLPKGPSYSTEVKQLIRQPNLHNENLPSSLKTSDLGHLTSPDRKKKGNISKTEEIAETLNGVNDESIGRTASKAAHTRNPRHLPESETKLTLFNIDYNKCDKSNLFAQSCVTESKDYREFSAIPFVTPKNKTSVLSVKNVILEKTQKSKLALMLSALRGDLLNNEDELDASQSKEKLFDTKEEEHNLSTAEEEYKLGFPKIPSTLTLTETKSIPTDTSTTVGNGDTSKAVTTEGTANTFTENENFNLAKSLSKAHEASPLVGIKLKPLSTTADLAGAASSTSTSIDNTVSSLRVSPNSKIANTVLTSAAPSNNRSMFTNHIMKTKNELPALSSVSTSSTTNSLFEGSTANCSLSFELNSSTQTKATTNISGCPKQNFSREESLVTGSGFGVVDEYRNLCALPSAAPKVSAKEDNFGVSQASENVTTTKPCTLATASTNALGLGCKPVTKPTDYNSFSFQGALANTKSFGSGLVVATAPSKLSCKKDSLSRNFFISNADEASASFNFGSNSLSKLQTSSGEASKKNTDTFTFGANSTLEFSSSKCNGFKPDYRSFSSEEPEKLPTNPSLSVTNSDAVKPVFNFMGTTSSSSTAVSAETVFALSSNACTSNNFGSLTSVAAVNTKNPVFTFGLDNNSGIQPVLNAGTNSGGFSFSVNNNQGTTPFTLNAGTLPIATSAINTAATSAPNTSFSLGHSDANNASKNLFKSSSESASNTNLYAATSVGKPLPLTTSFTFTAKTPTSATHITPAANTSAPTQQNSNFAIADRPFRRATRRLQKS